MAIFTSGVLSAVILWVLFPDLLQPALDAPGKVWTLVISFLLLFMLGFLDDLHPLSPSTKFGIQFLLSSALYLSGFQISNISDTMGGWVLDVTIIDYLLTVLWIVGITNAFNLIDGLDGLATGVAAIATVSLCIVSLITGQHALAVISLMLAGSMLGFLRYNFHPATIFLGDSGSLVIGFSIALLSIESASNVGLGMAPLFPLLVLMLPISDTIVSMTRRLLASFLEPSVVDRKVSMIGRLKQMFTPDRSHIHHRLLSMGFSHRRTVLLLYTIAGFCSVSAFVFLQVTHVQQSLTLLVLFSLLFGIGIKKLNYSEISILSNGLVKQWFEKWIVHRSALSRWIDFAFALVAYGLAYGLLSAEPTPGVVELGKPMMAVGVAVLQVGIFWGSGLYRERMYPLGIGNMIQAVASVFSAAGMSTLFLILGNTLSPMGAVQFFLFDFYLLMTLVLGYRMMHETLAYWFNKHRESGEKVLLYGAGDAGIQMLNRLTSSLDGRYTVLGFLDDDPDLEGETLFGYPVFGGHWELSKSYLNRRVECLIVCDDSIKTEHLNRLGRIAEERGITMKRMQVVLNDLPTGKREREFGPNVSQESVTVNGEELASIFQSRKIHTH
ncbi:MAG: hypothetical protein WEA36_07180 [Balneolaceae bacterium]